MACKICEPPDIQLFVGFEKKKKFHAPVTGRWGQLEGLFVPVGPIATTASYVRRPSSCTGTIR